MTMAKTKKTKAAEAEPCVEDTGLSPQTREEYIDDVLQQVSAYEERLDELESGMESSGWDDMSEYRSQLDDLRLKLRGLRTKTEELEAIPDHSWASVHEEMEASLADVGGGVEDLASGLSLVLPE
jgi:phage shock protein A